MHLKIFDKNEKYICNLTDLITAEHEEELNGKDILTFSIDINNQNADKLEKKGRVVYKDRLGNWKEFIIEEIEETHDIEGGLIEVYCESSFYETFGDYIDDKKPRNASATLALGIALEPTRWEVGRVDNLGINSCNFYHMSAKEAVHKVAQLWKGEIRTRVIVSGNRITRRYVDLLQARGYNLGKRYEYSKDLTAITRTVKSDYVITALYGYGKGEHIEETDGYGRRIDFADVVWSKSKGDPIDKPKGQKWIGTNENRIMWGRNDPSGAKAHVFDKVEFDDIEDPEELLRATWEEYKVRCQPLVTYEGKVIDLKEIEGKSHEGVGLGDTVAVIDKEFNPELRIKSRIVSHRQDLLNPANDEVVLGNFMDDITTSTLENKEHIDNFRGKQGVWDRSSVINNDGTINAQYLENLVKEMNERLNSRGGYVYLSEDGQGLTTYNRPIDQNPTMAIQLLGGAFRIANRRKPNGEFDWRTFGDGNGFVADVFIGGILKGGKVHFDLTNGTLLIGNNPDDYALYWDGKTLNIKGNVDISTNPTVHEIKEDIIKKKQALENDINNTSEELKNDINSTSKELKNDINNTNTELENIKMNTYTKYEIDSQFKIQDSKIASKVSGVAYDKDKENINLRFSEVTQTIDGVKLDVKDYKDGKLTGQTYNFDGRNFSIGGKSGDIAEHDNKKSKYIHNDGSYTEINAKGLYRYDANLELEYHHMTKIIKFSAGGDGQAPSTQWIPIGPEFNNKKWSAALSISDSMQASSNEATIHRIVLTQSPGQNPRLRNGQWEIPILGYKTNYNWKNDSRRYGPIAGIMIVTA